MFLVKKKILLLIAGVVWFIAGFNVARLGVISYLVIGRQWYLYLFSVVVFLLFGMMFFKMSQNHTKRIMGYEEYCPFWNFFDRKAYTIMVCMMSGGIGLRAAGIFSDWFVAFFYTGLGCALGMAGVIFMKNYFFHSVRPIDFFSKLNIIGQKGRYRDRIGMDLLGKKFDEMQR